VVTVAGILIGIGTAFIASGYSNIMNYIQPLFSFFNAPLFATFIVAMFWKRTAPWAGVAGLWRLNPIRHEQPGQPPRDSG
jgi:solute:Na+ symporter, SSS family